MGKGDDATSVFGQLQSLYGGKALSFVDDTSSSIVQSPYEFSKIFEPFTS